jgi:hypothetical protein
MTTLDAYAHHTPSGHVLDLNRGGGPVFGTLAEAMTDVPTGKEVVQVAITSYGWCRFAVQGIERPEPFTTLEQAAEAAVSAGLPLNAVRTFTAVNDGDHPVQQRPCLHHELRPGRTAHFG